MNVLGENKACLLYTSIKAVTPGQAAVFYQGDVCLGGGTIEKVYKDNKEITYL